MSDLLVGVKQALEDLRHNLANMHDPSDEGTCAIDITSSEQVGCLACLSFEPLHQLEYELGLKATGRIEQALLALIEKRHGPCVAVQPKYVAVDLAPVVEAVLYAATGGGPIGRAVSELELLAWELTADDDDHDDEGVEEV